MQLFGYVCSPHCKEKADLQGIAIPVYAGQRDVAQNREWGQIALVAKLAALFVILLVGVWFWYAWFGSRPKPSFMVRFEHPGKPLSTICKKQLTSLGGASFNVWHKTRS